MTITLNREKIAEKIEVVRIAATNSVDPSYWNGYADALESLLSTGSTCAKLRPLRNLPNPPDECQLATGRNARAASAGVAGSPRGR